MSRLMRWVGGVGGEQEVRRVVNVKGEAEGEGGNGGGVCAWFFVNVGWSLQRKEGKIEGRRNAVPFTTLSR